MDSLTHIVIGACIGELFAGKELGKRSMFLGAALQSIPDIDFLASLWLDPVSDLLAHRGFTHSLLFAILVTPVLAWIAARIHSRHNLPMSKWFWFFGTEIAVHLFLDGFNAYGTGWFEPFSHYRVSFNVIFVADPLFSIVPFIAFMGLLFTRRNNSKRKWIAFSPLVFVCAYLVFSVYSKMTVAESIRQIADKENIQYKRSFTTPTPLNNLLWFTVLETDSGYYTGYRSLFDTINSMPFSYFPRNAGFGTGLKENVGFDKLKRFSQGYYTLERWNDTLVFSDLRFGQIMGWKEPRAHFSFYYYLELPDQNLMVIQRGRFAKWNYAEFKGLLKRIGGK